MSSIQSVAVFFNHKVDIISKFVERVAKTPSLTKKILQITTKNFKIYDLYALKTSFPEFYADAKGTIAFIELYGLFAEAVYWINPFRNKSIDQEKLKESLEKFLNEDIPLNDEEFSKGIPKIENRKTATEIVKDILEGQEEHYSREDILLTLRDKLIKEGYFVTENGILERLKEKLIIQQSSRPLIERLYMVCFTVADLGTNLETFQKWNFIDLGSLSAKIGSQSPVFAFAIKLGADTILGVVGSAGVALVLGEAIWKSVDQGRQYVNATDQKIKKDALKKFKVHLIEVLAAGTDLVSTAAPLIFVLSPQTVLILAIVAKGTAVVAVFVK